jgi:GT2 family glycosyltransferase
MTLQAASLLICTRNRPKMLLETIQSVLKCDEIPMEIVVIDQSDEINPHLSKYQPKQKCEIRYFWSQEKGVSLGRNMAAAAAKNSILVFTDDDMLFTPSWFGSIVRALVSAGHQSVVTGRVLTYEEEDAQGFAPSTRTDETPVIYRGRVNQDVLFTNNMTIYKTAFDDVGGFDTRLGPGTRFPAAEDNDFCFKMLDKGYCILYDPQPTLFHRAWRTKNEYLQLYWKYGYGQGAFYAKYFSLLDTFMIKRFFYDVWSYLIRFPLRFFRKRDQAYQDVLFVAGLLIGALHWKLRGRKG